MQHEVLKIVAFHNWSVHPKKYSKLAAMQKRRFSTELSEACPGLGHLKYNVSAGQRERVDDHTLVWYKATVCSE